MNFVVRISYNNDQLFLANIRHVNNSLLGQAYWVVMGEGEGVEQSRDKGGGK